jgi:hypothetical protein
VLDNRQTVPHPMASGATGVGLRWFASSPVVRRRSQGPGSPTVLAVLLLTAVYVAGLCYLLWVGDIWTVDLLGDTLFWFFGPASVLLFRMNEQKEGAPFFRKTLLELLSITVIFEFLTNVYPLPLVVEIVLVPFLVLVGGMMALTAAKPEFKQVRGLVKGLSVIVGFVFIGYAVNHIVRHPDEFASLGILREFLVPLLLTVGLVPFLYLVAVLFAYDWMLTMLKWKLGETHLFRHARWRALGTAGLRLSTVKRFSTAYPAALVRSSSMQEVDEAAARIKHAAHARADPGQPE